jgi:hypothetical protein
MALPTTNLTIHLDASDTDKLFKTWVDGLPHTGTPADGEEVQAWSAEAGYTQPTPTHGKWSLGKPVYNSTSSPMLLPCLDFGASDSMRIVNDTASDRFSSWFFEANAKTILMAFYADTVAATAADIFDCNGLIKCGAEFGLLLKDVGGTPKLFLANKDGTTDTVSLTISTSTTHVLCARHDGTNIYLSLDGGAESSAASGSTATWPTGDVVLGVSEAAYYDGRIGEIAGYNAALTGSDLTDAIAYFRLKWQGVGGSPDGEEALAGSAITPGHGTQTPGISISI